MSPAAPAARPPEPWADALLAAALFAVDPAGVGGVSLHAYAGPVRDAWVSALRALLPAETPWLRTPASVGDAALLGGLDLSATLDSGRPVSQRGLLARAHGGVLLVGMAERLAAGTAARLTAAMDTRTVSTVDAAFGVVAMDESEVDEERPAPALVDRMAFLVDLRAVGLREACTGGMTADTVAAARALLPWVTIEDAAISALCRSAGALGIATLRPCLLAVSAARAQAALCGRMVATLEDAAAAARLVLSPRALMAPDELQAEAQGPAPPDLSEEEQGGQGEALEDAARTKGSAAPADVVLDAAKAAIPLDLLARLGTPAMQRRQQRGAGTSGAPASSLRGRPIGVREAAPRDGQRLNVVETLRAAAPWQRLRRAEAGADADRKILVRTRDFRTHRLEQRSRTTTIFVVDASGSSAFNRLAEVKGAVEMLLADCYRRRDEVAVLAFRGKGTVLLLPPTRSLVRAKRSLAGLPGGGPTPLAAGIQAGVMLALSVRRSGFTPTLVFLTDGSGNIALDGAAGRARAGEDATLVGRQLRASSLRAVLVDTSPRPQAAARTLAAGMGALYLPLPYADAAGLSRRVKTAASG